MEFDHNQLFAAFIGGWAEGRADKHDLYDNEEDMVAHVRHEFEDWFRNQPWSRSAS